MKQIKVKLAPYEVIDLATGDNFCAGLRAKLRAAGIPIADCGTVDVASGQISVTKLPDDCIVFVWTDVVDG